MAPLTPFWKQPSHPSIQKVILSTEQDFTTKSLSTISLPPFGFYAKMAFPPCTLTDKATYATVQITKDKHLNLNSDLVYINHSCVPSVIFDTTSLSIIAGPEGLKAGQELTFFYPSTEWDMDQKFKCFCGAETCRGWIGGAKAMKKEELEGLWLNAHIRELLEQRDGILKRSEGENLKGSREIIDQVSNIKLNNTMLDATEIALIASLKQAEKMVEAAKHALAVYTADSSQDVQAGDDRNGGSNRERSGELGGDTSIAFNE